MNAKRRLLLLLLVFVGIHAAPRDAAAAFPDCFTQRGDPGVFARSSTVDVWAHIDDTPGAQDLRWATGLSTISISYSISRALHIWNDASGAAVKLRYRGVTTNSANPANGIIIRAVRSNEQASCTPNCDCAGVFPVDPAATAQATGLGSGGVRNTGYIRFWRRGLSGMPATCTTKVFSLDEDDQMDFVYVVAHEIGHAVFNIGHSNDPGYMCGIGSDHLAMMKTSNFDGRGRVLKDFDIEIAQQRYQPHRGSVGTIQRSYKTGPAAWQVPFPINDFAGLQPLQRMGSVSSNYSTDYRFLGWVNQLSSVPVPGGDGTPRVGRYRSAFQTGVTASALPRAVAVAKRPGSTEIFVAYHARSTSAPYVLGSDISKICYSRSTNNGGIWSSPVCPANALAYRPGLAAAYEPVSNTFLVGFIGHDGSATPFFNSKRITFLTVPASTNGLTPTTVTVMPFSTHASWHAPSIACGAGAGACRVYFEAANWSGTLSRFDIAVSALFGTVGGPLTVTSEAYAAFDTPSAVWDPTASTYRIVNSVGQEVYSYEQTASGPLVGTGLVWNDGTPSSNRFISTAVIGHNGTPQVWFLRYW